MVVSLARRPLNFIILTSPSFFNATATACVTYLDILFYSSLHLHSPIHPMLLCTHHRNAHSHPQSHHRLFQATCPSYSHNSSTQLQLFLLVIIVYCQFVQGRGRLREFGARGLCSKEVYTLSAPKFEQEGEDYIAYIPSHYVSCKSGEVRQGGV